MKRKVMLGDIEFTVVEDEKPSDTVLITDNSVESGQDVSDHVKENPSIINIYGQMMGDDAAEKLQKLKRYQKDGELLTYVGRNLYDNMAIQGLERDHGTRNKSGFGFSITLKQVRIATAKEVAIEVVHPETKVASKQVTSKTKPVTQNGKQQLKTKVTAHTDVTGRTVPFANTPGEALMNKFHPKNNELNMNSLINTYLNKPKMGGTR